MHEICMVLEAWQEDKCGKRVDTHATGGDITPAVDMVCSLVAMAR